MSLSYPRVFGVIVVSVWLAGGCSEKKIDVGGSCVLNSDCNQGLVCSWGKCHEPCHKSVDCPAGQSCVQTNSGPVCQLPAEADCRKAACSGALVCASDLQCRSGCVTAADCTNGQLCVGNVCADPGDLELNGQLPQKSTSLVGDGGADGGGQGNCSQPNRGTVGASCVLISDCNQSLACIMSKCHGGCQTTADCPAGESCVKINGTTVCQLPAEADCTRTMCSGAFVCASDLRCRSTCLSATDCTGGQVCVGGVCADPVELDVTGVLPQKGPSLALDGGAAMPVRDAGGRGSGPDLAASAADSGSNGADVPVGLPDGGLGDGSGGAGDSGEARAPDAPSAQPDVSAGGTSGSGGATGTGGATGSGNGDAGRPDTPASQPDAPMGGISAKGGTTSTGGAGTGGAATGGTSTSGGTTSAGGITTAGGTIASGGTTSAGGNTTAGGTTTSGGTTSAGGTTTAGGSISIGGATVAGGGSTGTGGSSPGGLPCDILNSAGQECVSAHSTVRVIVSGYSGPLYQLCLGTANPGPSSCQGTTQDIGSKAGYADSAAQDTFCSAGTCTMTKIYDQSGQGNDLEPSPRGGFKTTPDNPAKAGALPLTINGLSAYGILIKAGIGYRTGCSGCNIKTGNGMATGDQPQTIYMVTSQNDLVDSCCFDYGNAETDSNDDGNGTMEAVNFGAGVVWGTGNGGKPGPWVMADLENGLYAGWEGGQWSNISTNQPLKFDFVTAIVLGDTQDKNSGKGRFALYGADATGADATYGKLTTMYDGIRPEKNGYVPMQKQGSLILGTGGDNSNGDGGQFYEGAVATGPVATKATLDALQAAIVATKYGQ